MTSLVAVFFSSFATTRNRVPRTAATAIGVRTSKRVLLVLRLGTVASTRPFLRENCASAAGASGDFFTPSIDMSLPGCRFSVEPSASLMVT